MNIKEFEKVISKEKELIINEDMKTLCLNAQNMTDAEVKSEAQLIARASEYASKMIIDIIKQLL